MVIKAAEETFGSGGPTRLDADAWKHMLCSRVFQKVSEELAGEIAKAARRVCTEDIPHIHT